MDELQHGFWKQDNFSFLWGRTIHFPCLRVNLIKFVHFNLYFLLAEFCILFFVNNLSDHTRELIYVLTWVSFSDEDVWFLIQKHCKHPTWSISTWYIEYTLKIILRKMKIFKNQRLLIFCVWMSYMTYFSNQ